MAKLVTYDLRHADIFDYKRLSDAIQSFETASRITESCWLVVTSKTALQLGNYFIQFIHEDDRMFVVDMAGSGASWTNPICGETFLKSNINL